MPLQPHELYEIEAKLQAKGYKQFEVATAVEHWTASVPPPFKYKTPFPATAADCKSSWGSRVFRHTDWVDGSSLVQAGETPSEEGFNNRFHDIENDLDRLGASIGVAFGCVGELRATLATVLNEIAAQFDLVAAVIASCCARSSQTTTTTIAGGTVLGHMMLREEVEMVVVAGSDGGIVILPKGGGPGPPPGNGVFDPTESRTAALMRILASNSLILGHFGHGEVSKDALLENFGDVQVDGGQPLREVINILPSGVMFQSLEAMVDGLAESEHAVVRSGRGTDAVIAGVFSKPVLSVESAPIESFSAISAESRAALSAAGINTVGDVVHAGPEGVYAALGAGGVDTDLGEAGAIVGAAKLMGLFG